MIRALLQLYIYIIIVDVIMSYFPQLREQQWARTFHKIADAPQKPIRDLLPKGMPLDPTPMIIIIVVQVLMYILQ
jgi:YggT family protein